MKAIQEQIQKNIEELKIRSDANQEKIRTMKAQAFKPAMYKDHELELARIAGMIDTWTSAYQMIENR